MAKYLKLGEKAQSFYDMSTCTQVTGKEIIMVTEAVYATSKKIKQAVSGGHLVFSNKDEFEAFKKGEPINNDSLKEDKVDILQVEKDFMDMVVKNGDMKSFKKAFNMGSLIALCEKNDITPEENDKKEDLIEALISIYNS